MLAGGGVPAEGTLPVMGNQHLRRSVLQFAVISQKSDNVHTVFEFVLSNNERILTDWQIPDRRASGKLKAKIDMLRRAEVASSGEVTLPSGAFAGPSVYGCAGIYKVIVEGEAALRPMFCKGPIQNAEWTFLARASKKDNDTSGERSAARLAVERREQVKKDPERCRLEFKRVKP